ncbi:leucine-rich_repeat domain-containing protein [Hexamita inflata]|uniref:Leucine-rich repeat domain-containing protein n=1 Tax=Hexamita inflata TaxID=28002 RepID=A0AA86QZG7_9EUKA|nr:leucine-rich repeat domain-containing protein [Hexamita inflata]
MKHLNVLDMAKTQIVDLHPLQHLYTLQRISAFDAFIMDVSPLSQLTQLDSIHLKNNKIINADSLKHRNFSEYDVSDQEVPITDELKFHHKILAVHSSHKQIRNGNKISKLRHAFAQKKNYVSVMLNNQIMVMNKELNQLAQFIQNSNTNPN